jgi:hypothetical protein
MQLAYIIIEIEVLEDEQIKTDNKMHKLSLVLLTPY